MLFLEIFLVIIFHQLPNEKMCSLEEKVKQKKNHGLYTSWVEYTT